MIKDPGDTSVPHERIVLINTGLKTGFNSTSGVQRFYLFPAPPVGHYNLWILAAGFRTQEKTDLVVDTDAALWIDVLVGQRSDAVTVSTTRECKRNHRQKQHPSRLSNFYRNSQV
jgi:hypothetical protein